MRTWPTNSSIECNGKEDHTVDHHGKLGHPELPASKKSMPAPVELQVIVLDSRRMRQYIVESIQKPHIHSKDHCRDRHRHKYLYPRGTQTYSTCTDRGLNKSLVRLPYHRVLVGGIMPNLESIGRHELREEKGGMN